MALGDWTRVARTRQSRGRLCRVRGRLTAADAISDRQLAANVKSSWAYAVARLGDLDRALTMLKEAESHVADADHGRLLGQIGTVLFWMGDLADAVRMLGAGAAECARHDDGLGEVRYRSNLGAAHS